MSSNRRLRTRRANGTRFQLAAIAILAVFAAGNTAIAAEPIVRVEEDWEIQMGVPDPADGSPQIINVISPTSDLKGQHAVFELNHMTEPVYFDGGLQLHFWNGAFDTGYGHFPNVTALTTPDETITYSLSMELKAGTLRFEVRNGTSQTWGKFGGQGYLKQEAASLLSDLNAYDPAVSVKHSQVGFATHRVRNFVLKQVRCYASDGSLVSTKTTESVVHFKTSETVKAASSP